jgi:hypothetical protein
MKYWVEVVPKDEFKTANGALDVDKAREALTHDMWNLRVRRFDPALVKKENKFACVPFSAGEVMSFPAFAALVRAEYADHIRRQLDFLRQSSNMNVVCPVCGLSAVRTCGCPGGKYQGCLRFPGAQKRVAETRDQIARKFDEAFPEIRKRMTEAYVKKMLPPFLRACALAAIPITGAILVARKFVFL